LTLVGPPDHFVCLRQTAPHGLKLNDAAISDPKLVVDASLLKDGVLKLSSGKKRHVLIKPL
jgi:tyrosyl-tRNA synthetase